MRHRGVDHITAGRVQNALGFAGRAGSVKNEKRVFGLHFFWGAIAVDACFGFVVPDVAPRHHIYVGPRAGNDNNACHTRTLF